MKIYMKILKNMQYKMFLVDEVLKFSFCPRLWHIIFVSDYFKNQKNIFRKYIFDKKNNFILKLFGFCMIFVGFINVILNIYEKVVFGI